MNVTFMATREAKCQNGAQGDSENRYDTPVFSKRRAGQARVTAHAHVRGRRYCNNKSERGEEGAGGKGES